MSTANPRILPALLAIGALAAAVARAEGEADARSAADALIDRMKLSASRLKDATFTFYKQEWVDGELRPEERIFVKQRYPRDLYMRWDAGPNSGQELIYRSGWNNNKMKVDPSDLLPNLDLDPRGAIARDGERHTIFEVGPVSVTNLIVADAVLLRANPSLPLRVVDLGASTVYGEPARCLDMTLPKDREPRLYGRRVVLCANTRTGLPARTEIWDLEDGALRVVERYGLADLHANLGLTDQDFSPENPEYGF